MDMLEATDEISATEKDAYKIKAVESDTVHRICSGQVIVSLATAVKELVENSLDAGAKNIEIRLMEYGSETIEVTDDGDGIKQENFQALTLKHYTSKLQYFSDLLNMSTFGFRGEALSSLCALSNVSVITKHKDEKIGTQITYDKNGKITSSKSLARSTGTTVILQELFHGIPVRRKEFLKNLKREFNKMVNIVSAYCLIATSVRITCYNTVSKVKKIIFQTRGKDSIKDNILDIFGSKALEGLLQIVPKEPEEEDLTYFGISGKGLDLSKYELNGFVSSCAHGMGRSSNDRQFYFINSRPCDPGKISKLINELYRQNNRHQYPFVFLSLKTPKQCVDVNVTPDKRQLFLLSEKFILAWIRSSIRQLFVNIPSTFVENSSALFTRFPTKPVSLTSSITSKGDSEKGTEIEILESSTFNIKPDKSKAQSSLDTFITRECLPKQKSLFQTISCQSSKGQNDALPKLFSKTKAFPFEQNKANNLNLTQAPLEFSSKPLFDTKKPKATSALPNFSEGSDSIESISFKYSSLGPLRRDDSSREKESMSEYPPAHDQNETSEKPQVGGKNCSEGKPLSTKRKTIKVVENEVKRRRKEIFCNDITFCLEEIETLLEKDKTTNKSMHDGGGNFRKFLAKLSPDDNSTAERELSKNIQKSDFQNMEIIGQFNLGFIVSRHKDDLFIIDQHASDEKHRFEALDKNHIMESQAMVIPKPLELTASTQALLLDNIDVFRKNGYDFMVERNENSEKVFLSKVPHFRDWTFGTQEIDELLFLLSDDHPTSNIRPSKVRSLFASRACRTSVMIGTCLSKQEMKRILVHMGEMEQPWNCPHGRPTMRHLVNLNFVRSMQSSEDDMDEDTPTS